MKKKKGRTPHSIRSRKRWMLFAVFAGLSAIGMTWAGISKLSFQQFALFCLPGAIVMLIIMFYCFKKIKEIESDINTKMRSF